LKIVEYFHNLRKDRYWLKVNNTKVEIKELLSLLEVEIKRKPFLSFLVCVCVCVCVFVCVCEGERARVCVYVCVLVNVLVWHLRERGRKKEIAKRGFEELSRG